MKILVCLKQVPHKDARLEASGGWIDEGGIKFEINQYDTYALEEALRIKDAGEAEVVVATIGPDRTSQALRTALGMGADRAIQIWDDSLSGADSLTIAKLLAAAAKDESFDLVLMGLMSDDANNSLTGPMLAELLGLPHTTGAMKIELSDGKAQVERELEGGSLQVVDLPLPCLITVQTGLNEVRYASLKGIMQAKKKPLDKKGISDLGLDAAAVASKVTVDKLYVPTKGEGAEILEGSAGEVAQQLVGKIKELGLL
ncbi:MAG: electron transfer flavoprotein subunit beta/FixA family protein [Deltaproteobacteria bacterium]|nr:electron transfer flavoprotein subunit beta/FixA family protein [Deltaproteobacteria bacterium]MBW2415465.1 electron transfer flavoprotein subunit beta/FixA family protein [Deltaproteobacteria bacterium]